MSETNREKTERIKAFIKKGQPKVTGEHFDWSQFKNLYKLEYDEKSDSYSYNLKEEK